MFRSFFDATVCSDENIDDLATIANNMSGSDIANIVNGILFEPIRTLCRATHFVRTVQTHLETPEQTSVCCIAVANKDDIDRHSTCETLHVDNVEITLLFNSLSDVVLKYGEDCVVMQTVDFGCIRSKVQAFRHTVSREYLQQYVTFHDQQS